MRIPSWGIHNGAFLLPMLTIPFSLIYCITIFIHMWMHVTRKQALY